MIDIWVESLTELISNYYWLTPLLAFLVGIITSLTPCCLSNIPLIIAYVNGTGQKNSKRAFRLSAVFALGSTLTLITLGVIASAMGKAIGSESPLWHIILGVVMLLMALQSWDIINLIPQNILTSKNTKKGYIGAFITGILGGIFSTPCQVPVLVALLAIVAEYGILIWGILLLLFYAIGHSILVLFVGTSIGLVQNIIENKKFEKLSNIFKVIMGTVIMLIALYMFYLAFN